MAETEAELSKKLRGAEKKLRQITDLKECKREGKQLNDSQRAKIYQEADLLRDIAELKAKIAEAPRTDTPLPRSVKTPSQMPERMDLPPPAPAASAPAAAPGTAGEGSAAAARPCPRPPSSAAPASAGSIVPMRAAEAQPTPPAQLQLPPTPSTPDAVPSSSASAPKAAASLTPPDYSGLSPAAPAFVPGRPFVPQATPTAAPVPARPATAPAPAPAAAPIAPEPTPQAKQQFQLPPSAAPAADAAPASAGPPRASAPSDSAATGAASTAHPEHPSGTSVASWEEAELVMPSSTPEPPPGLPVGGRSSLKSAAEEEDDRKQNDAKAKAAAGRAAEQAQAQREQVLDRLYNFKAAPKAATADLAPRLGELRHLDTLPAAASSDLHAAAAVGAGAGGAGGAGGAAGVPECAETARDAPSASSLTPSASAKTFTGSDSSDATAPADGATAVVAATPSTPPARGAAGPSSEAAPTPEAARAAARAAAAAAAAALDALGPLNDADVEAAAEATVGWLLHALEGRALPTLSMSEFELLRMLGKGGYGKVFQVRCKLNGLVYAMKVVDKAMIERHRSMDNIAVELAVLRQHAEQRHPFILALECAFHSEAKLHFVTEFVPGGMLFNHLRKQEMFSEKMARFYAAETLLALEHLHAQQVLYRDLKPENVLICASGHIKLCDFGLASFGLSASATHTSASGKPVLVGTTEYMAPEVVRQMACGQAIDGWALGVLLFEMMTGDAPWYHRDAKELQRKIVHTKLKLPPWLTNEARTLMRGLLTKDPSQRFGVKPDSAANEMDWAAVKAHPFFRALNWKLLLLCKLEPPYVPALDDDEPLLDVSNFDVKYTGEVAAISPLRKPLSQGMEQQFEALALEYVSPQARDSIRLSAASSLCSRRSSLASNVSNGDDTLLRFLA